MRPGPRRYLAAAGLLALAYVAAVVPLWLTRPVEDGGPLNRAAPAAEVPPAISDACRAALNMTAGDDADYRLKVVGGPIDGRQHYGCYRITASSGRTFSAEVIDGDRLVVNDPDVLQRSGAWTAIGLVKTPGEAVGGLLAIVAILTVHYLYWRRPRPGPPAGGPWWTSAWVDLTLGLVPIVGWIIIARLPGRTRARRVRVGLQIVLGWIVFFLFVAFVTWTSAADRLGGVVLGLLAAAVALGWLGGRAWLRPEGWGTPDGSRPPARRPEQAPVPAVVAQRPADDRPALRVVPPSALPTFADVGGMEELKTELRETVGLLLAFDREADALRIDFNGILLHGPPGVGKTFIAKAAAGEFGLNLLAVSVADLASPWVGEASRNIAACFTTAAASVPVLLLFDEFDSVATRREDSVNEESRRAVNQLLQSLEAYRGVRSLVVVATTNSFDQLDPAVIRPGRFDRRIRVDLPDLLARRSILGAQLAGRATTGDVDLDDLAARTKGLSPAALAEIVDTAALSALRATAAGGQMVAVGQAHLRGALQARGGRDRPTVERHGFDRLVLDPSTEAELRQLQLLLTEPDTAARYGVEAPSGVLLTGPPGTGKTSIARALAAEAHCSFYPATTADLTSKWVGEGEERIRRLFHRAREHAPSIVFLDEIDGVAGQRGGGGLDDRLLSQLLAEIDGMAGNSRVFVLAATNRPDVLDPALTRGGRLSRTIHVGLPDGAARLRLLALFSEPMPLAGVDLQQLAASTEGWAGADLEALCQQAAVAAMIRAAGTDEPSVTGADFATAQAALARGMQPLGHR